MKPEPDTRPKVVVTEVYTFDLTVDSSFSIDFVSASGEVSITLPYDKHIWAAANDKSELNLAQLDMVTPNQETVHTLAVRLPIGADLDELLRSNREAVWSWQYTPPEPDDTLLTVEAQVIDGANFDPLARPEDLYKILFEHTNNFTSDLRIQLNVWVSNRNLLALASMRRRELHRMLLEQESDVQIFLLGGVTDALLAESLAALANSSGGRILIGVHSTGKVEGLSDDKSKIEQRLLKAALCCQPPIIFNPPELLENGHGHYIASVNVPRSKLDHHVLDGKLFTRRGAKTISEVATASTKHAPVISTPSGDSKQSLAELLSTDSHQSLIEGESIHTDSSTRSVVSNLITLGGSASEVSSNDLGRALCALINSELGSGKIVIRQTASNSSRWGLFVNQGASQKFDDLLNQALKALKPSIENLRPEFTTIDGAAIVILNIALQHPTVASFQDVGYIWNGTAIRELDQIELYARYMARCGQFLREPSNDDRVMLLYGSLNWPMQPNQQISSNSNSGETAYHATFDPQWRAQTWRNRRFQEKEGSNGVECILQTNLRHSFAKPGLKSLMLNDLEGSLHIQINKDLFSDIDFRLKEPHEILSGIPIHKRTQIIARLNIATDQIFSRRRRTSMLHFQVTDIWINFHQEDNLVADLQQICADSGFLLMKPFVLPNEKLIILQGFRNTKHQDVHLTVAIQAATTDIARELHFEQRIDSKHITSGYLDVRVVLSGIGDHVSQDLAELQLSVGQLIQERLHYLRTE